MVVKNRESLTPLQLSAKHGVTELFEEILNMKNVYCYISANDGFFYVKEYDITEIYTVSVINLAQIHNKSKAIPENFEGIAKNIVQSNKQTTPFVGLILKRNLSWKGFSIVTMIAKNDFTNGEYNSYLYFMLLKILSVVALLRI